MIQEVVAGSFGVVAALHAFFQNEMAVEAFMHGPGEGQTAVVGLHGAAGDDGVGALSQSVGDGEVQLTGLVAAGAAGEQVVALHVHVDLVAQGLGQVGQIFDGGSFLDITTTGELSEIHSTLTS